MTRANARARCLVGDECEESRMEDEVSIEIGGEL
jgi:hypothetical protein